MALSYKQKCFRCKKNYVTITWRNKFPLCYDCQKSELSGEIADPKLKKLLDLPEEFYQKNAFLRSIKINAIRFGHLSEKQIEYFKKTVDQLKKEKITVPAALPPAEEFGFSSASKKRKK